MSQNLPNEKQFISITTLENITLEELYNLQLKDQSMSRELQHYEFSLSLFLTLRDWQVIHLSIDYYTIKTLLKKQGITPPYGVIRPFYHQSEYLYIPYFLFLAFPYNLPWTLPFFRCNPLQEKKEIRLCMKFDLWFDLLCEIRQNKKDKLLKRYYQTVFKKVANAKPFLQGSIQERSVNPFVRAWEEVEF